MRKNVQFVENVQKFFFALRCTKLIFHLSVIKKNESVPYENT